MVFVRKTRPAFVALFVLGMMCLGIVGVSAASANITFDDLTKLDHSLILRPDESIQLSHGDYHVEPGTDFALLFLQNRGESSIEFIIATNDGQSKIRMAQTVDIEEIGDPEFIWSTGPETVSFAYDKPIPIYQITGVRKRDGQAVISSYMARNPSIQAQLHDIHMVVYVRVQVKNSPL